MDNVYEIALPCGQVALVDTADRDLVTGFNWKRHSNGYVYADRFQWRIALHRLIAGPKDTEQVDHRNGDPLDNRSINLRTCNQGQNNVNRGAANARGKTSIYRGVSWSSTKNRWCVYLSVDNRTRYIGRFTDEIDAARAYDRAAAEYWGEFARLNNA